MYVGNGAVGESSAITIQCGFKPKFLWVTTSRSPGFNRGQRYNVYNLMQSISKTTTETNSYINSSGFWLESLDGNNTLVAVSYGFDYSNNTRILRKFQTTQSGISFYAEKQVNGSGSSLELTSDMQLNDSGTYYYWVAIGDVTT